jgi:hypothetical protein
MSGASRSFPQSAPSGSTTDAATVALIARPRVSVGARGTIYAEGVAILPPGGKTMSWPLQVRADCSGLGFTWGSFQRAGGYADALPLTHYYLRASIITPIGSSFADPVSLGATRQLNFGGTATKRVDPGGLVHSDPLGGNYDVGTEIMVRQFAVGEGTIGVLGAAIVSTGATTITGPQLAVTHPLYGKTFYIKIDSEYLKVTAGTTGTSWTVTRGVTNGVVYDTPGAAATHSNGATVAHCCEVPTDWSTAFETNSVAWDGDKTMNFSAAADGGAARRILSPVAMWTQKLADPTLHCAFNIGDSRSRGQGESVGPDVTQGFPQRACDTVGIPYLRGASAATGLPTWTTQANLIVGQLVQWVLPRELGASIAIIALGTNRNLESGATLFSELSDVIDICYRLGLLVVVCTIPPDTDPGDTPLLEQERLDYNALIRTLVTDDRVTWVADSGGAVSADGSNNPDVEGSFWGDDVDEGILGTDLHDTTAGHIIEASVLAAALQHVIDGDRGGISTGTFSSDATPSAPSNTVAPTVSGTGVVGDTLTSTTGTWTGTPTSYTYQWTRDGTNISGATASTHVVVSGDIGTALRCKVAGVNATGSGTPTASSNAITGAASATAPGQPTGLALTPGDTTLAASWTAPASNGGSAITTYLVEWRAPSGSGSYTTFVHGASTTPSITITGLTNGVLTGVRVSAVNAVGTGTPTAEVTATPVASFDPSSLSSKDYWLKPESLGSGTQQTWTDSFGNSHSPTQATAGARPTVLSNALNGLKGVLFDGVDDSLQWQGNASTDSPIPVTRYFLARFVDASLRAFIADGWGATFKLYHFEGDSNVNLEDAGGVSYGALTNQTSYHVFTCIDDGTTLQLYIDGVAVSHSASGASGVKIGGLLLGINAGGANPSNVEIVECIGYTAAHNNTVRGQVEAYLKSRGGL